MFGRLTFKEEKTNNTLKLLIAYSYRIMCILHVKIYLRLENLLLLINSLKARVSRTIRFLCFIWDSSGAK